MLLEKIHSKIHFSVELKRFSPNTGDVLHVVSRNVCFPPLAPHDWSQRPFGHSFSQMTQSRISHTRTHPHPYCRQRAVNSSTFITTCPSPLSVLSSPSTLTPSPSSSSSAPLYPTPPPPPFLHPSSSLYFSLEAADRATPLTSFLPLSSPVTLCNTELWLLTLH